MFDNKNTPARDPKQQNKTNILTNNLAQHSFDNIAKISSYGRFALKIGTGLKFPAKSSPLELHSSHGDSFRDQTRFRKTMLFLAAFERTQRNTKQQHTTNNKKTQHQQAKKQQQQQQQHNKQTHIKNKTSFCTIQRPSARKKYSCTHR